MAIFFIERTKNYAAEREVFGRPIGKNQGIQFPLARAFVQLSAARLMVEKAATMFDEGVPCGSEANMAKMLASEASWAAAEIAIQTHGGFGFAEEFDIERKVPRNEALSNCTHLYQFNSFSRGDPHFGLA